MAILHRGVPPPNSEGPCAAVSPVGFRPFCGSDVATQKSNTRPGVAFKPSRGKASERSSTNLIGLCGVGCRDAGARASLRCAMRAGTGSARRPSASARDTSRRRRRAPQTGSATQPVPPGATCAHTAHGAAPGQQQPANKSGLAATVRRARGSERAVWRRESTPQRGPPTLRGGRRPFRQQAVQLAGWQRDMPSSIVRRCTAETS